MEELIMQAPEQYLWGYNRYKQPRRLEATGDGACVVENLAPRPGR
jgi:hypothetical protein